MSTQHDLVIVLRAVMTLRGTQKALDHTLRGTPEWRRLGAAVAQMQEQLDLALEDVADQLMEHANDD
jgi:hypothetical protein